MSHGKTALICDDDAALGALLKHVLSKHGFEVRTASDGQEGLELLAEARPDLLLLDLAMPHRDGLAVLEALKTFEGKRPYTVVVSSHEAGPKLEKASELGAQEVWKKPFNAAELIKRVEKLMEDGLI